MSASSRIACGWRVSYQRKSKRSGDEKTDNQSNWRMTSFNEDYSIKTSALLSLTTHAHFLMLMSRNSTSILPEFRFLPGTSRFCIDAQGMIGVNSTRMAVLIQTTSGEHFGKLRSFLIR
jgi:hypothetical protein